VGISDRTLEKIRIIKETSVKDIKFQSIWEKVGSGKMKIDKGFKKTQKILKVQEALLDLNLNNNSKLNPNKILLLNGDMRELVKNIKNNSIDLIFTDPPYTEELVHVYKDLAEMAQRVLKPGGSLVTFIGHHVLSKIVRLIEDNSDLKLHWEIAVRHTGHKKRLHAYGIWAYWKPLLWYYKLGANNELPTKFKDLADLIESTPTEKNDHEWEQSTVEASHMIEPLNVEGMTVLDPFMGSGTTGLAARKLNRRFIGIEKDNNHFTTAKAKLSSVELK
jgi:site-specific DNA-methyltransferase (adenine-specific)/modification methylase